MTTFLNRAGQKNSVSDVLGGFVPMSDGGVDESVEMEEWCRKSGAGMKGCYTE